MASDIWSIKHYCICLSRCIDIKDTKLPSLQTSFYMNLLTHMLLYSLWDLSCVSINLNVRDEDITNMLQVICRTLESRVQRPSTQCNTSLLITNITIIASKKIIVFLYHINSLHLCTEMIPHQHLHISVYTIYVDCHHEVVL